MQPLYFVPNVSRTDLCEPPNRAKFAELGLSDIFGDIKQEDLAANQVSRGPGNLSGVIVTYTTPDASNINVTFEPDRQTWLPLPDADSPKFFIGMDNTNPPTPADMRRRLPQAGYDLELKGQEWSIPVIRRPDGSTLLPRDIHPDFENPTRANEVIDSRYAQIWQDTERALDWVEGVQKDPPEVPPMGPACLLCIQALGLNYRYGVAEQHLLGLVGSHTYVAILSAMCDFPKFAADEAAKKNSDGQDATNSTPGDGGASTTTDLAEQTC